MKTLFTGHNGFLGKELIPKLSNEYHISTYDGDILDYKKLNNFVESNAHQSDPCSRKDRY